MEAFGIDNIPTGFHYHLMTLDDLVTLETISTKEQIEKTKRQYRMLIPIISPGSHLRITGTRYDYDDLYAELRASQDFYLLLQVGCRFFLRSLQAP